MILNEQMEQRLTGAIERLEALHETLSASASIGPIVATIENEREAELERRLAEAEATIASLRAQAATAVAPARKTLPAGVASMLAKQGLTGESVGGLEAGALALSQVDGALISLSIEQRIAVKAELLRAGLLR
ncbi:hypothetical protein [Granulicella rosea]|nr:hypothetical protein [Granulicella rosea]